MSLSDVSDLTDLSSDGDEPLAKRTARPKKPREYKISNVLRAPRTAQYTARSLYDQIIDNAVDLDPEYQRDVVWHEEKQSGLIDSILRNYYIPPIIFAVTVQEDGSELRTCIDGKQRLTSIQRFIDGQIPHKDSFTNEKLWFKSGAASAKRKLLPQHLRTLFSNKQIVCVEYQGLDNDQEREIFQRVQLGVALTPAERLQALVGPWSTVIREIQSQVLGDEGFEGYLDWGHARGRDFQCLATIGYLIESYPKTTIPGTKTLEKWLQKPQAVSPKLRADIHETFRIFVTLARDKKYSGSLNRPTRVSPIEFVMIGLLIYLKRQTLSLMQISSAIEKMRKDVRASHQDIRSNTRITKHLTEFITKKLKVSDLKSDGEGDMPAAAAIAKTAKAPKRKRPVHSDDSDSEPVANARSLKRASPVLAPKPSKQASTSETSSANKVGATAPVPRPGLGATSLQSPRLPVTNTSLSSTAVPAQQSISPTVASQTLSNPLPPSSTMNGHSSTITPVVVPRIPLAVQTSSTVKVESPQINSLNSPTVLSVVDRLAPIRAAKASLSSATGAGLPPSISRNSQDKTVLGPGSGVPPLLLPTQASPGWSQQNSPVNPVQGQARSIPPQLAEALESLRAQIPQLSTVAPVSTPGPVHPSSNHNNMHSGTPQGPLNRGTVDPRLNPNGQTLGLSSSHAQYHPLPQLPQQQPYQQPLPPTPTSASAHPLPPRPSVSSAHAPNRQNARLDSLPSRPTSSETAAHQDGNRRGSYGSSKEYNSSRERYHSSGSSRHDRQDYDRDRDRDRGWSSCPRH